MRLTALLAAATLSLAFAGCSDAPPTNSLMDVYPDAVAGNATSDPLSVPGSHIEGRVAEGPWGSGLNFTVEAGNITGPAMAAASALGGGGESAALTIPANATATLSLRLRESDNLTGYFVQYSISYGAAGANATGGGAIVPAEEEFHTAIPHAGPFTVKASILPSKTSTTPLAWFRQALAGQLNYHWHASGEVQPQKPQDPSGGSAPWPTTRDAMADKYSLALLPGATVTATTAFDGTYSPGDGVDIDLGLYGADGQGIACAAGSIGTGSAPNNPAQANEAMPPTIVEAAGTYTVEVGAMADGCPTNGGAAGSFSYSNTGPVPYTLDVIVG